MQRLSLLIGGLGYLGICLWPDVVLATFGGDFADSRQLLPILGLGVLGSAFVTNLSSALVMTPHLVFGRRVVVWPIFFVIVAMGFVAEYHGLVWVAWLMTLTTLLQGVLLGGFWRWALRREARDGSGAG